jgi:hypothetical protein
MGTWDGLHLAVNGKAAAGNRITVVHSSVYHFTVSLIQFIEAEFTFLFTQVSSEIFSLPSYRKNITYFRGHCRLAETSVKTLYG